MKKIIVVTDGDQQAWRVVSRVAAELGLGFIDITGGNPTRTSVHEVEAAIVASPCEVVVVLADDAGAAGVGPGERLIELLASSAVAEVAAAVAVASWDRQDPDVRVDKSVTAEGVVVKTAVDKEGRPVPSRHLSGDTVGVLADLGVPVVGVGDIGEDGHACDAATLRRAVLEALRLAKLTPHVLEPLEAEAYLD